MNEIRCLIEWMADQAFSSLAADWVRCVVILVSALVIILVVSIYSVISVVFRIEASPSIDRLSVAVPSDIIWNDDYDVIFDDQILSSGGEWSEVIQSDAIFVLAWLG